jgi:hypothetical protein
MPYKKILPPTKYIFKSNHGRTVVSTHDTIEEAAEKSLLAIADNETPFVLHRADGLKLTTEECRIFDSHRQKIIEPTEELLQSLRLQLDAKFEECGNRYKAILANHPNERVITVIDDCLYELRNVSRDHEELRLVPCLNKPSPQLGYILAEKKRAERKK